MNKKDLSERDIITQFIMPAIKKAGWNIEKQVREEVFFTDGRIYVKGNITARGTRKFADIFLYHKPNIPIAIIEAKDNKHKVGAGLQQGLVVSLMKGAANVSLADSTEFVETQNLASLQSDKSNTSEWSESNFGPQSKNIASIIRGFKIGVKKYAVNNNIPFKWQPRFYDHIIRDENDLKRIRKY